MCFIDLYFILSIIFQILRLSGTYILFCMVSIICCRLTRNTLFIFRDRLVYPPSLFLITVMIGYCTFGQFLIMGSDQITFFFWMGVLFGYFCYDITHYALHHVDTSKNKGGYFHKLQKYHNQHHFGGE